jgi:hypothetical protein
LASCSSSGQLFIPYTKHHVRQEKIDTLLLGKIERDEVSDSMMKQLRLKLFGKGDWYSFTIQDDNSISQIDVSREKGKIASIEKKVFSGDTTSYYSYYPNGRLMEKSMVLLTPYSNVRADSSYFANVKIGTQYSFTKKGRPILAINYDAIFTYTPGSILQYCASHFPNKQTNISNIYIYEAQGEEENANLRAFKIKIRYPYWNLGVPRNNNKNNISTIDVYLIDGKTGILVHQSSVSITPYISSPKNKKL